MHTYLQSGPSKFSVQVSLMAEWRQLLEKSLRFTRIQPVTRSDKSLSWLLQHGPRDNVFCKGGGSLLKSSAYLWPRKVFRSMCVLPSRNVIHDFQMNLYDVLSHLIAGGKGSSSHQDTLASVYCFNSTELRLSLSEGISD